MDFRINLYVSVNKPAEFSRKTNIVRVNALINSRYDQKTKKKKVQKSIFYFNSLNYNFLL